MAIGTEAPAAPTSPRPPRVVGAYTGRERPAGGWELWTWLFMRVSGLVLLVLAVGHVLIMHVVGGGVSRVNFGFVALRWQSPFWRSWDWAMLSLALLHGVNGLRVIVQDHARYPWLRFAINMFFYVVGFSLFVLGTVIVFTFDPSRWPGVVK